MNTTFSATLHFLKNLFSEKWGTNIQVLFSMSFNQNNIFEMFQIKLNTFVKIVITIVRKKHFPVWVYFSWNYCDRTTLYLFDLGKTSLLTLETIYSQSVNIVPTSCPDGWVVRAIVSSIYRVLLYLCTFNYLVCASY